MKTIKPYTYRRRGESDEDKWLYVKNWGKDVVFITPFIEEAIIYNWHDEPPKNIPSAFKKHYIK